MCSCVVERYPVSIMASYSRPYETRKIKLKKQAGLLDVKKSLFGQLTSSMVLNYENFKRDLTQGRFKYLGVLLDIENIYNAIYLGMTIAAYSTPEVYAFLMLDIVKRSDDLQNIIKAVTKNYNALLKITILALIFLGLLGVGLIKMLFYNLIIILITFI